MIIFGVDALHRRRNLLSDNITVSIPAKCPKCGNEGLIENGGNEFFPYSCPACPRDIPKAEFDQWLSDRAGEAARDHLEEMLRRSFES